MKSFILIFVPLDWTHIISCKYYVQINLKLNVINHILILIMLKHKQNNFKLLFYNYNKRHFPVFIVYNLLITYIIPNSFCFIKQNA